MKMPSNYMLLIPVGLLALLSLKYTALADSSGYECQYEDDVTCTRDLMAKCIKYGNRVIVCMWHMDGLSKYAQVINYSNKCNVLCHQALEKLIGQIELEKRAQRRKQNKNLSNVSAMQLLPMRKRDVADTLAGNPELAQALGLTKRDTYSALADKRLDKTFAQQLGLLKKRDVSENNYRSTRAAGPHTDTCGIVLEEVASRLVVHQVEEE